MKSRRKPSYILTDCEGKNRKIIKKTILSFAEKMSCLRMSLADAGGVLLNGAVKQSTNHNNYKDANVVETSEWSPDLRRVYNL